MSQTPNPLSRPGAPILRHILFKRVLIWGSESLRAQYRKRGRRQDLKPSEPQTGLELSRREFVCVFLCMFIAAYFGAKRLSCATYEVADSHA